MNQVHVDEHIVNARFPELILAEAARDGRRKVEYQILGLSEEQIAEAEQKFMVGRFIVVERQADRLILRNVDDVVNESLRAPA